MSGEIEVFVTQFISDSAAARMSAAGEISHSIIVITKVRNGLED